MAANSCIANCYFSSCTKDLWRANKGTILLGFALGNWFCAREVLTQRKNFVEIKTTMTSYLLFLSIFVFLVPYSIQLQSSQIWSLLQIQRLLNYPPYLSNWNNYTDACYAEPNPRVTVVCYEESITQLQITGNDSSPPLPRNFSIDSFFTTLTRLPNLKVLSLGSLGLWGSLPAKISRLSSLEIVNMSSNYLYGAIPREILNLRSLQTLILDHNIFAGRFPDWLSFLSSLAVLSLKNNTLDGPLPDSVKSLESLRVLDLSLNSLSGLLPDLQGLTNLQVLDLEGNFFGPQFPNLGKKVVTLVLRKNRFIGGIPSDLGSYYMLERLDISLNRFVGPFMPSLLSLPSIRYLDISGNRFTGMLSPSMTCNGEIDYVDVSSNLLAGSLPTCLTSKFKTRIVLYSANCLSPRDESQHPNSFCRTQALAVGILPQKQKEESAHKAIFVIGMVAAVLGATLILGLFMTFFLRRANTRRAMKRPPRRLIEHASNGYPSKMLADARYISQTMKLGALGVPSYRSFSLEELEAATNNFERSSFMGEGPHGQMYRGRLDDGSLVAIRCLKLKRSHSSQNFNRHIELISKLRYRHLVSALGHCFEYHLDNSNVSRLFLVFEYVSNGTLRSNISEDVGGQKLTWVQRISVAIGVAKGIQFLHAGIIPGLFDNDIKTTNILLDQNLVAKIRSYNLPVLAENMKNEVVGGGPSKGSKEHIERARHGDKVDIYDFGVMLLEIIFGRPMTLQIDVEKAKYQLRATMTVNSAATTNGSILDPELFKDCCKESLKTVIEVCARCLSKEPSDRPSVEDVLWNLQFAAQVQYAWRGYSHSDGGSPMAS